MTTNAPDDIPGGFKPMRITGGVLGTIGPLYGKWTGERLLMGFRVESKHCNLTGVAQGGMLAAFADILLPVVARVQARADVGFSPTVSLAVDFIGPAKKGVWIEGQADILNVGKSLFFTQGLLTADGAPCLRASGVFRVTGATGNVPNFEMVFGD